MTAVIHLECLQLPSSPPDHDAITVELFHNHSSRPASACKQTVMQSNLKIHRHSSCSKRIGDHWHAQPPEYGILSSETMFRLDPVELDMPMKTRDAHEPVHVLSTELEATSAVIWLPKS